MQNQLSIRINIISIKMNAKNRLIDHNQGRGKYLFTRLFFYYAEILFYIREL